MVWSIFISSSLSPKFESPSPDDRETALETRENVTDVDSCACSKQRSKDDLKLFLLSKFSEKLQNNTNKICAKTLYSHRQWLRQLRVRRDRDLLETIPQSFPERKTTSGSADTKTEALLESKFTGVAFIINEEDVVSMHKTLTAYLKRLTTQCVYEHVTVWKRIKLTYAL